MSLSIRKGRFVARWTVLTMAALLMTAPAAFAQGGDKQSEEEEGALLASIEELVISARKREESAQSVPIAVTALGGKDLEVKKIDDTLDIQFKVPNLFFGKTNFTGSNLQIRGIGSAVVGASGEPAVGIHVNTVPLTTSRIFEQEFFDIERIEVLRGPQGTLFGRNSTGGSFNIYTRKPTDEFESTGEVQFGNFATNRLKGAINIPITDKVRARFAGMLLNRDGFVDNLQTGNNVDDRRLYGVRASFEVDATENTKINAMVSWFKENDSRSRIGKQLCTRDNRESPLSIGCSSGQGGLGVEPINTGGTLGGILETWALAGINPAFSLYPFTPSTAPGAAYFVPINVPADSPAGMRVHRATFDPEYSADELFATLDVGHEFENFSVNWVSGYQRTNIDSKDDYLKSRATLTWTPSAIAALQTTGLFGSDPTCLDLGEFGCQGRGFARDQAKAVSEQVSTELRAVSDFDGPLNATVGAMYSYFVTETDYKVFFPGAEVLARLSSLGIPGYDMDLRFFNNETKPARTNSFGLFGEGYWELTDTTNVTLGLRYTRDEKDVRSRTHLLESSGAKPPFVKQQKTWSTGTGRLSLDQELDFGFTDQSMVFGSISRGFKPGGFNPSAAVGLLAAETFDPETVWAYEIGTKNRLLDNRLQANLSAFFYDYQDYQVSKIVSRTSVNENVNAYIWGLEAEFIYLPINDVQLDFSLAYLGTRIRDTTSIDTADLAAGNTDYIAKKDLSNGSDFICLKTECDPFSTPGADPRGGFGAYPSSLAGFEKDLDGKELPNTPDIQINLGGQYTFDVPWNGRVTARMSYYWQSDMFGRMFNENRDKIASWSQADASMRWNDDDERVYVEFWIKNFTDNDDITTHYLTDASSGNFTNVFLLDPRTLGATVGVSF